MKGLRHMIAPVTTCNTAQCTHCRKPEQNDTTSRNMIKIVFQAEIDEDWFNFTSRLAIACTSLMKHRPFLLDIPEDFLINNPAPNAVTYHKLMHEINSALTPEEHRQLKQLRHSLHNL